MSTLKIAIVVGVVVLVVIMVVITFITSHKTEPTLESEPTPENPPDFKSLTDMKPISQDRFVLFDGMVEFRIELLGKFTQEEINSKTIVIVEKTWNLDSENNVTVWFNSDTEEPVHSMVWSKGSEF